MTRRLLNLMTPLSLLLCVASVVLWVRSFRRLDEVAAAYCGRSDGVARMRGLDVVSRPECLQWTQVGCEIPAAEASGRPTLAWEARSDDRAMVRVTAPWVHHGFGVAWESQRVDTWKLPGYRGPARPPRTYRYVRIAFPHWLVILAAAVLPACRARQYLRTRRRAARKDCCTTCGYDLRATPGRCPECGQVAAAGAVP